MRRARGHRRLQREESRRGHEDREGVLDGVLQVDGVARLRRYRRASSHPWRSYCSRRWRIERDHVPWFPIETPPWGTPAPARLVRPCITWEENALRVRVSRRYEYSANGGRRAIGVRAAGSKSCSGRTMGRSLSCCSAMEQNHRGQKQI